MQCINCSNETKRQLESKLQQNISEIEELRRENSISQQEYQAKLQEANNKSAEKVEKLVSELGNLREKAITGEAKSQGFWAWLKEDFEYWFFDFGRGTTANPHDSWHGIRH